VVLARPGRLALHGTGIDPTSGTHPEQKDTGRGKAEPAETTIH
jgi:hypothetical protein